MWNISWDSAQIFPIIKWEIRAPASNTYGHRRESVSECPEHKEMQEIMGWFREHLKLFAESSLTQCNTGYTQDPIWNYSDEEAESKPPT